MSHMVDETYSVYEEPQFRARKEHQCDACRETIRPGDVYTRCFVLFDGKKETHKRCERCQAIHDHLKELGEGETWPAERLDCGESYEGHWGCEPPEEIAALAFWLPGDPLP